MKTIFKSLIVFFLFFQVTFEIEGQEFPVMLLYPDTAYFDTPYYGLDCKISGNHAVVSSCQTLTNINDRAVVGFYQKTDAGWALQTTLNKYDFPDTHGFCPSLAVEGDFAVIGNPYFADTISGISGIAHVYQNQSDSWELLQTISQASNYLTQDFGRGVAIEGNWMAIGDASLMNPDSTIGSGAVFVYHFNGNSWEYYQFVQPSEQVPLSGFGYSVDFSDDHLVVGSFPYQDAENTPGAVHFFRLSDTGWMEQSSFSDEPDSDYLFGVSVAVDADYAVVGAASNSTTGYFNIYKWNDHWEFDHQVFSPDDFYDGFAYKVSIKGKKILASAYADSVDAVEGGAVYLYLKNGDEWDFETRLEAPEPQNGAWFGYSVDLSDDECIVGEPYHFEVVHTDIPENIQFGAAYVFDLTDFNVAIENPMENLLSIKLSPNPVAGVLEVSINEVLEKPGTLYVTDALGRVLLSENVSTWPNQLKVDVSAFSPGVYFVEAKAEEVCGMKMFVKK